MRLKCVLSELPVRGRGGNMYYRLRPLRKKMETVLVRSLPGLYHGVKPTKAMTEAYKIADNKCYVLKVSVLPHHKLYPENTFTYSIVENPYEKQCKSYHRPPYFNLETKYQRHFIFENSITLDHTEGAMRIRIKKRHRKCSLCDIVWFCVEHTYHDDVTTMNFPVMFTERTKK